MIKTLLRRCATLAVSAGCAFFLAGAEASAEYPERPIRFVVPFATGGSTDIAARVLADRLAARMGATIVVENQGGANGLIGAANVVRAEPDGYTLLVTSDGIHSAAATGTATFNLETDLKPVSRMVGGSLIIVGGKTAPFDSIEGMVAYARDNPGQLDMAVPAALGAAHMTFETFRRAAEFDYQPIFYGGEVPSVTGMMTGDVHAAIVTAPAAISFVDSDQVNGLAVTTEERFALLPDVPTIREAIDTDFAAGYATVMFAPPGTSHEIIELLSREIAALVHEPEMQERLLDLGMFAIGSTPEEYAGIVSREFESNARLIQELRDSGQVE